ncbi:MAG: septum formation initiator family protein [Streptosporangiales bacterium]|nr:septum formation initiator family protein [Streptosporangiales bacterium]
MSGTGKRPSRGPGDASRRTPTRARRQKDAGRSTARPDSRRTTATNRRTVPDQAEQQPELSAPAVRRRFTSRAAVLLAVICLIVVGLAYPLREYVAQRAQIQELEAKKRNQQEDIGELRAEQRRLQDPAYIEQQARKRLHYAKPGELTYVVVDDRKPGDAKKKTKLAGPSWSQRLWGSVRVADRPNG